MTAPLTLRVERANAVAAIGLVLIAGYFAFLTWAVGNWDYERWVLIVLTPVLLAAGVVMIAAVTRHDEVPLTGLLVFALIVKLGASFVRYYVSFSLYGRTDASRYHGAGTNIAHSYHRGEITIVDLLSFRQGTPFVEDVTGAIYSLMGPTRLGGFLVFSWIGFWGLFLFHRAALAGVPNADQKRYAALVCLLPSLVFWPSSIGKEALMLLSLGGCAYGAARVLERRRGGWPAFAAGFAIAYMVRPHVGVVVLAALIVATMFRPRRGRPVFGPGGRVVIVALLVAALAFVLGRAVDRLLPVTSQATGVEAVGAVLDRAESGTDEGGSEIDRPSANNPLEYPGAAFSVLFRPTILEANSAGDVFAALETTFLLGLFVVGWRRVRNAFVAAFRQPYILFCVVYTAVFTFAWSAFANLGALARQRVQAWPFLLVLVAMPLVRSDRFRKPAEPAASSTGVPARR